MAPPPPPPPYDAQGSGQPNTSGNIFNILSLVGGIVSIVLCWVWGGGILFAIPAIILGVMGRKKAAQGEASNGTLGMVGLILGIVGAVFAVIYWILLGIGYGVMQSQGNA